MVFITKLGSQVSLSPVPFFGVNKTITHLLIACSFSKALWHLLLGH
jgi:hypothetical protein